MALLSKDEAAKELNVPVGRLDRWRWNGIGPAFVTLEKEIRYHPDDVQAYIAANRKRPAMRAYMESSDVTAKTSR